VIFSADWSINSVLTMAAVVRTRKTMYFLSFTFSRCSCHWLRPALPFGAAMVLVVAGCWLPAFSAPAQPPQDVKRIILEEQKIEGKIRRPQLVLIKADQRPEFEPMVMQSFGKKADIIKGVESSVIEGTPYTGPFRFENKTIVNYAP
jgi:hypothetical protein